MPSSSGNGSIEDRTNHVAKLEALLHAAVDAIVTINDAGLIQSVNRSAEELFGYSANELEGLNVKCLMPDPWASEHDEYMRRYQDTGEKRIIGKGREVEGKRKDDTVFPMHLSVSEYRIDGEMFYTGIIHDLSRRKQAELALMTAQKMEAIGQLTGGIAHDFNNLLTVITGNLELLEDRLGEEEQLELLTEAQEAAELGSNLTNRLLAFARRSVLQPQTININAQIEGLNNMLTRSLGGNIDFEILLAKDLWDARVDPGQIDNALLNLAVNARDAMPNGGRVVVETANMTIDDVMMASEAGLSAGDYVRISVSDTGTGMDSSIVQRVFEPFFTTKEKGRGTGLGLSMVYGFAKQSGGHATIYSEPGVGTTVNIYLPRECEEEKSSDDVSLEDASAALQGQGQLVLVVEDDARVQKLTLQRLEILNYRALAADNGSQALRLLETNADIDLVFTDLVMPGGISGYELAEILARKFPTLPVLMTSGYAEDLVHADELRIRSLKLLRKPYKLSELAENLHQLLNRSG